MCVCDADDIYEERPIKIKGKQIKTNGIYSINFNLIQQIFHFIFTSYKWQMKNNNNNSNKLGSKKKR